MRFELREGRLCAEVYPGWWFVWEHFRVQDRVRFFAIECWQAYWKARA